MGCVRRTGGCCESLAESKGTSGMVALARAAGVKTYVVEVNNKYEQLTKETPA